MKPCGFSLRGFFIWAPPFGPGASGVRFAPAPRWGVQALPPPGASSQCGFGCHLAALAPPRPVAVCPRPAPPQSAAPAARSQPPPLGRAPLLPPPAVPRRRPATGGPPSVRVGAQAGRGRVPAGPWRLPARVGALASACVGSGPQRGQTAPGRGPAGPGRPGGVLRGSHL